jgi:hypothetical protein
MGNLMVQRPEQRLRIRSAAIGLFILSYCLKYNSQLQCVPTERIRFQKPMISRFVLIDTSSLSANALMWQSVLLNQAFTEMDFGIRPPFSKILKDLAKGDI